MWSGTITLNLDFLKNSELCTKRKRKIYCKKMSPHLSQLNVAMAHRNYFRQIICESSNWQHIQRLKITILGAIGNFLDWKGLPNVHILFCLHKTSSFTDL